MQVIVPTNQTSTVRVTILIRRLAVEVRPPGGSSEIVGYWSWWRRADRRSR